MTSIDEFLAWLEDLSTYKQVGNHRHGSIFEYWKSNHWSGNEAGNAPKNKVTVSTADRLQPQPVPETGQCKITDFFLPARVARKDSGTTYNRPIPSTTDCISFHEMKHIEPSHGCLPATILSSTLTLTNDSENDMLSLFPESDSERSSYEVSPLNLQQTNAQPTVKKKSY